MEHEAEIKPVPEVQVESIALEAELERKLGEATVRVGNFRINEVLIWRHGDGAISVFLPSTRRSRYGGPLTPHEFKNLVEVPDDVRAQIVAAVKAAYKERMERTK